MKAVLASLGYADPYTAPLDVHGVCSWARQGESVVLWEHILQVLPQHTPKAPGDPNAFYYQRCFYRSEPSLPTEKEAKLIFEVQYKNAFPGKRLGTKHAKEKWEATKVKAMEFAMADYTVAKAAYDSAQLAFEASEAYAENEYRDKIAGVLQQIELIEKLKGG